MALIKLGGLAQDVRGSQNGLTFSRNKGGAYVRAKVSPVQPRTALQQNVRGNLSQSAKDWSGSLTVAERAAWAGFASSNTRTNVFGDTTHLSGLQWFVGLNQVLKQISEPTIQSPPTDLGVPANRTPIELQSIEDGSTAITYEAGTVEAGVLAYIWATPPLAPGKTPSKSLYRWLQTGSLATSSTVGAIDILTAFTNKYGPPIVGKKISVIVANVNTATGATTVGQKFDVITQPSP